MSGLLKRGMYGLVVLLLLSGCRLFSPEQESDFTPLPLPTLESLTPMPIPDELISPLAAGNIAQIWANEGGDKVTRNELRASRNPELVLNAAWNGTGIELFGAGNEVISFNLILEAPINDAEGVVVELTELRGPNGYRLRNRSSKDGDPFDYRDREIELFYIRYLQIKGVSTDLFFSGYNYDERHIPERCRRPIRDHGEVFGGWVDRPCHDLFFPEIAIPLAFETPFDILAGTNQAVWGDIYLPSDAPPGVYQGVITVSEGNQLIWEIPIQVRLMDFNLPDLPSARTMVYISRENIKEVYLGNQEISDLDPALNQILDRHFAMAHRHRISLIDSYLDIGQLEQVWLDRLNGELFTAMRGYEGPGQGVGNNVYSIGTYGDWPWMEDGRREMWQETTAWSDWFSSLELDTPTEVMLYLIDESENYRLIEKWAGWIDDNPGSGSDLLSMATLDLPVAASRVPSLDIPASWAHFGVYSTWQEAADYYQKEQDKRLYLYNSSRPATGSFAIEDEGTALRQLAWTQYKMGVDRWFYWESTYYNNFQCYGDDGRAKTNVFEQAQTYGCFEEWDDVLGETGWNYLNGDGVLFYPGTDRRFPQDSYGISGPFASLRLKNWRRGIQDVEYLELAAEIGPHRTAAVVQRLIPAVLWELGVEDLQDPTYVYSDISWPVDPGYWEEARAELAEIILSR